MLKKAFYNFPLHRCFFFNQNSVFNRVLIKFSY